MALGSGINLLQKARAQKARNDRIKEVHKLRIEGVKRAAAKRREAIAKSEEKERLKMEREAQRKAARKAKKKPRLRGGALTPAQKELVQAVVADTPHEVTPAQITSLATVLNKSELVVRSAIAEARSSFVKNAGFYVSSHKASVQGALEDGQFDVAARHSEWALERLKSEGERLIEGGPTTSEVDTGAGKIQIGVMVGTIDKLNGR